MRFLRRYLNLIKLRWVLLHDVASRFNCGVNAADEGCGNCNVTDLLCLVKF